MYFSRISLRIGFWYSIAFFLSAVALFVLTAYILMESLTSKDRDLLVEKSREYSALYLRDGVSGLQIRVSSREIKSAQDFVVRLANSRGKTLFLYSPDRSDDADAPQLVDIDRFLKTRDHSEQWITIPGGGFGDDVEVYSTVLSNGDVLQVGKDTEDREAFFQSFAQAYVQGLVPIFLLAIAVGIILSHRLLKPIRTLTQTVESIRSGNAKARVPVRQGKDELHKLSMLFNELLEQTEKLLQGMRDTVDNVAHDLRTPIMRLQNSIEKALRNSSTADELKNALIENQESSETMLTLVNGILEITEAETGTLKLNLQPVQSSEILDSVIDLYGFVAEEKKISIAVDSTNSFDLVVDKMRLIQAVSNLLDNAIKYSEENSTITIETSCGESYGTISIRDEGKGISENDLPRVWDRLYRTDASRSSRGLGLGLSIVKAIIEAHGGTVGAKRNENEIGTTFFVRLPRSDSLRNP